MNPQFRLQNNVDQFYEVTCDSCQTWGMANYRYKCLRCADYDLCATCYNLGPGAVGHDATHPFQCLMDRATLELHFAGERIPDLSADSFTCPNCGEMGLSAEDLMTHVQMHHRDARVAVICPLCVAVPMAHPTRVNNLVSHLAAMHHFRPGSGFRLADAVPPIAPNSLPTAEVPQVRFILPSGLRMGRSHLALSEDLSDPEVADV
ncbi:hypothetical protein KR038_010610 [Drosophila bunnanda]|nr:hypothetical protein KR038_010610 [Drosophila bunnanda]